MKVSSSFQDRHDSVTYGLGRAPGPRVDRAPYREGQSVIQSGQDRACEGALTTARLHNEGTGRGKSSDGQCDPVVAIGETRRPARRDVDANSSIIRAHGV